MTPKEKAIEMISKQFDIIAKASNYKGLKKEGEKKFYTIENIAKQCAQIGIKSILNQYSVDSIYKGYWEEVGKEIEKL